MSGDGTGFAPHYQRVLGSEQRQSVLATIRHTLPSSATLGEIVDAADILGWRHGVGELSLVDLAEALLSEPRPAAENPPEETAEAAPVDGPATPTSKKPAAKSTAKKATTKKAKGAKSGAKSAAKSGGAKSGATPTQDAFDERMSLDEAVEAFVPLVKGIGEATMQDLEEATGLGRRKLRFHVGQLVKHGHLTRHGMGRGTFYTV
ncbi:MAG: hypothetical protein AAF721_11265 [Myxococcota bacterium]